MRVGWKEGSRERRREGGRRGERGKRDRGEKGWRRGEAREE